MRTNHQIAVEVDRLLGLSLSHFEFELLVNFIESSGDSEKFGTKLINDGKDIVFIIINELKS